MNAIEVSTLTKRYGRFEAVRGVSFAVARGEMFGVLGQNGAGKTSIINILSTLARPTGGTVHVNGHDVRREGGSVRRALGMVFQNTTVDDYLTVRENMRFHAYAYGVPVAKSGSVIDSLLELVGLADRSRDQVKRLSGGMKRRLELARALIHDPAVLVLDEPTAGLDPHARQSFWEYLELLRGQRDLTVLMTTHYMDEAEHCDRVAILDKGEVVASGSPVELRASTGGDTVTLETRDNALAAHMLRDTFGVNASVHDGKITFRSPDADRLLPAVLTRLDVEVYAISVHQPTMNDVFLNLTGHADES